MMSMSSIKTARGCAANGGFVHGRLGKPSIRPRSSSGSIRRITVMTTASNKRIAARATSTAEPLTTISSAVSCDLTSSSDQPLLQANVHEDLLKGRVKGKKFLPPPPAPPAELLELPLSKMIPQLAKIVAMTLSLGALSSCLLEDSSTLAAALAAFMAGIVSLPINMYQHDLSHMRKSEVTPVHRALQLASGIITGMHWESGAKIVHVNHHAVTGDFKGVLGAPEFNHPHPLRDGDQDDIWGVLRNGSPCPELAARFPPIRAAVMAASLSCSVFLYHPMFVYQGLLYIYNVEAKGKGTWDGRAAAAATLAHLFLMGPLLGPMGYVLFSMGHSLIFNVMAVPFHNPSGEDKSEGNYWYTVAKSTRSLRMRGNPVISSLMAGADYHLEHHLWEDVPSENLHALAPLAKQYCEENGVVYPEIGIAEGWKEALAEGWKLAATPSN